MLRNTGERQVGVTLDDIRKDHVSRYTWAARRVTGRVYDLGCGIGYGSKVLADAGCSVVAIDASADAIDFARNHYDHSQVAWRCADLRGQASYEPADAAIAFEIIEHLEDPRPLLRKISQSVPLLIASVPNESAFPYANHAFHHRHYTRDEFERLLNETGWQVTEWHGQLGPESPVKPDVNGRTLIAVCTRLASARPKSVAIVGLGPSKHEYASAVCGVGDRRKLFDQVWVINAGGCCYDHDLLFHMDDVRIQEIRAAARPDGNIAAMLGWLKHHHRPVMTSRAHPDYPALVELPLEQMINELTYDYFNSTAAWAMAYAIHLGVEKVALFGCDYTYANRHDAEKGRACLEFWMGYGAAKGIKFLLPRGTTLMDACEPRHERLYGYDTRRVILDGQPGSLSVRFEELEQLPTADEIEWRYDHNRHPNPIAEELHEQA